MTAMRTLAYSLPTVTLHARASSAAISPEEDVPVALVVDVMQSISTDLLVEIGGVTMFLAAWEEPEHWVDEWADVLTCDRDEVQQRVETMLNGALTEEPA